MTTEYIEKQEAVEIAMQYCPDDDGSCSRAREDIRDLLDELENLPPADVRPVVRGLWILDSDPGEPCKYKCDQCGETTTSTCMGKPRYNYCPMCGAYMSENDA